MTKTIQSVSAATLLAALMFTITFVSSASAQMMPPMPSGGDSVSIENTSDATISNSLTVVATTGDNDADGGDGEDGGDGGNATADNGSLVIGGNGGDGGTGGTGGRIDTGNALAIGTIDNDINNNTTRIVGCGCDDTETIMPSFFGWNTNRGDRTSVTNDSTASVSNDLHVIAETGDNEADGGDGDDGGQGGDAGTLHARTFWWFPVNTGTAFGGNGGDGGQGATGGVITTGVSQSDGLVTNVVNRNITRILR